MIYGIYSIKDAKTGFLPPTYDVSDESAIRNFNFACKNTDSLFFSFPSDYSLYRIGTFYIDSGNIISVVPEWLADATQWHCEAPLKGSDDIE